MTSVISQRELRNENAGILRAVVENGETFVITRNGVPSAELRPIRKRPVFADKDAFLDGRSYATHREGRLVELRANLDEVLDLDIDA